MSPREKPQATAKPEPRCDNCRHAMLIGGDNVACRRFPPIPVPSMGTSMFPPVARTQRCGEWAGA